MIKKATKISIVALAAGLMVGCASKSDITNLQTQIDDLNAKVSSVDSTAKQALDAANAANAKASAAESAALRAAAAAEDTNSKLDAMFKKSMMK